MGAFDTLQDEQVAADCSISRKINSLLNSPKTRTEGLGLLESFLPQCPDEDFLQFCVSWMQNCCKVDGCNRKEDHAILLLSDLFKTSSNFQELKKSVSFFITTRYFDFFFKHLLDSPAGWSCTETCMLFYRGACGPFEENFTKQLENEIERNVKISSTVAHCFALLPCVGGGGNDGIHYIKNWKTQFVKFLNIGHSLLEDLFADVEELQEYERPKHAYNKTKYENTPEYLSIQLHNHCSVLNSMLLSQYPSPKSIPTDLIFQFICRGLSVTPKALTNRQTTNIMSLQKILPEVHNSLLSLLKAVIVTCKSQLLPYSHLVCKLLSQTLECTESDFNWGNQKSLRLLRVTAYEVLCNWLATAGSGSCVEAISSPLISSAVGDIAPKKKMVTLKEAKHQKSKNQDQITFRMKAGAYETLPFAALKALQFLLKFAGNSLKPEEQKFLQEIVIKLIVQVQRSVSDMIAPFATPFCRLELYALLLELVLQPSPKWPPPTHFALRLLTRGLNDNSPKISSFCSTALSMTAIIIHPQFSNGGFPLGEPRERRNERDVELQWKEVPMEVENEISPRVEENVLDSEAVQHEISEISKLNDSGSNEKTSQECDDSGVSPNEDSTNTVAFTSDVCDSNKERSTENEEKKTAVSADVEMQSPKVPRSEPDPRPAPEEATETTELTEAIEASENNGECSEKEPLSEAKSASPESASEEGQQRKRYFLRSVTKGPSEEPETMKRTHSVDSLKSSSVKSSPRASPSFQSATKRPRVRASCRIESNFTNTPKKSADEDEDEDILEVFDDSLVDG